MSDLFNTPAPEAVAKGGAGFAHEKQNGGATVEWYTPGWVFERIDMTFDLDPCSPAGGLDWVPAARHYALPQDGLSMPWIGRIWCNPPYGPATEKWLRRMGQHRNGMALVFARTDTEWFHASVVAADAILFIAGRVKFVDRTGKPPLMLDKKTGKMRESSPGAGSMLVAWGDDCVAALKRMDEAGHGMFVDRRRPS
jgi:hypothetical protein